MATKPSDDEEVESVEDEDTRSVKVTTTVVKEQDEDECWDSDESGNIGDDYEEESVEEEDSNGSDKEAAVPEQTDSESDANLVEDGDDSCGEDEDGDDDISESNVTDMGGACLFGWPYDGQGE